jgi:hypothetical protein
MAGCFRQPRRILHRRLRGNHEQGQLPESAIQCGAGVEHLSITKIVNLLRGAGDTIADEDLARISPLRHQHVIPNGTYHFTRPKQGDDISGYES